LLSLTFHSFYTFHFYIAYQQCDLIYQIQELAKHIIIFKDLYDTYRAMGLPVDRINKGEDFNINNLKDLHPILPFKSIGYRPNYFSFLFVKNAEGKYTTDDVSFETKPGTIYFTNPGHFKSFEWRKIEEAFIITLNESFLKENVHKEIFKEFPFLLAETVSPKRLNPNVFAEFEQIYLQIYNEYHKKSSYRKKIIGSYFVILLLKIKEYFWEDYNPILEGTRSSYIVKTFKKDLETHFRELVHGKAERVFRVNDFASLQNLHPNYLSNVIKTKTGKSLTQLIAEKMISEARTLLLNGDISVKEISSQLGFAESAHFSSYFKKNTGKSPGQFKKLHS
jgi:AraC family transcriptional activator of pobA